MFLNVKNIFFQMLAKVQKISINFFIFFIYQHFNYNQLKINHIFLHD